MQNSCKMLTEWANILSQLFDISMSPPTYLFKSLLSFLWVKLSGCFLLYPETKWVVYNETVTEFFFFFWCTSIDVWQHLQSDFRSGGENKRHVRYDTDILTKSAPAFACRFINKQNEEERLVVCLTFPVVDGIYILGEQCHHTCTGYKEEIKKKKK